MATKLSKQLKREIEVDGRPYMVTLSPEGVKLTEKGKRLGREHSWKELTGTVSAGRPVRARVATYGGDGGGEPAGASGPPARAAGLERPCARCGVAQAPDDG